MKIPRLNAEAATTFRLLLFLFILFPLGAAANGLHHQLSVSVSPSDGTLRVEDTITVDRPVTRFEFILNAGFSVRTDTGQLETLTSSADGLRTVYRATPETATTRLKLHYEGRPAFSARRSLGGMPQGIVAAEGVYLDGASVWYPLFDEPIAGMAMTVSLPDGWHSISIGQRSADGASWSTAVPHDEIYLLAGRFTRHARRHRDIDLSVWLLDDEPALAERYLDVIGGYLDHYATLIGDYPYAKFAVVENRWQTGFGMPSFTLLGSRVMRLPFIPYTSLPHEILHNWWGNGVWIDHARGNWSEGLTAYLADHWMQERRGRGQQYRLQALQRYTNFAVDGQDKPLLDFISRHNDASQSIGYSKSLMLFHMLRRELGDARFVDGLRRLWRDHRFEAIGFADAVRAIIGDDPERIARYERWLERPGAPQLALGTPRVTRHGATHRLTVPLRQVQDEPFVFDLPLTVTLVGETRARRFSARVDAAAQELTFDLPAAPARVDIDPGYDLLRYLDPSEQPPALNRLFGGDAWLVLPTAEGAERSAWVALARTWQWRYPGLRTIDDSEAAGLDDTDDRIVLGWANRHLTEATDRVARDDQRLDGEGVFINGTAYTAQDHAVVLVNNRADGATTAFIGAPTDDAVAMLARKLPHYGSYGRLVFDAANGGNRVKTHLESTHSRLSHTFTDPPVSLDLPPDPVLGAD